MYNSSCYDILSWILDPKKSLYEKRLTCHSQLWNRAYSHQAKMGAKKIKRRAKRSKNKRQRSKIISAFAFAFVRCEWAFGPKYFPYSFVIFASQIHNATLLIDTSTMLDTAMLIH